MAAAEAGNEPQHEEMETSGQSGNVVRVGPSRISDYSDRPLQTLEKVNFGCRVAELVCGKNSETDSKIIKIISIMSSHLAYLQDVKTRKNNERI